MHKSSAITGNLHYRRQKVKENKQIPHLAAILFGKRSIPSGGGFGVVGVVDEKIPQGVNEVVV